MASYKYRFLYPCLDLWSSPIRPGSGLPLLVSPFSMVRISILRGSKRNVTFRPSAEPFEVSDVRQTVTKCCRRAQKAADIEKQLTLCTWLQKKHDQPKSGRQLFPQGAGLEFHQQQTYIFRLILWVDFSLDISKSHYRFPYLFVLKDKKHSIYISSISWAHRHRLPHSLSIRLSYRLI